MQPIYPDAGHICAKTALAVLWENSERPKMRTPESALRLPLTKRPHSCELLRSEFRAVGIAFDTRLDPSLLSGRVEPESALTLGLFALHRYPGASEIYLRRQGLRLLTPEFDRRPQPVNSGSPRHLLVRIESKSHAADSDVDQHSVEKRQLSSAPRDVESSRGTRGVVCRRVSPTLLTEAPESCR